MNARNVIDQSVSRRTFLGGAAAPSRRQRNATAGVGGRRGKARFGLQRRADRLHHLQLPRRG